MNAEVIGERTSLVENSSTEGTSGKGICGDLRSNLTTLFISTIPAATSLTTSIISVVKDCELNPNTIQALAITASVTGVFSFFSSTFSCCCLRKPNPCLLGIGFTVGAVGAGLGGLGTVGCI